MAELGTLPSIARLLGSGIPVEALRDVVGQVTHITAPPVALIEKSDVWVDI